MSLVKGAAMLDRTKSTCKSSEIASNKRFKDVTTKDAPTLAEHC